MTDEELAAKFDQLAKFAGELSSGGPAYALLPPDARAAAEAEAMRQQSNMKRAAHALRVKGMLVEALEAAVEDHELHCSGDQSPQGCSLRDQMRAALAEARKEPT